MSKYKFIKIKDETNRFDTANIKFEIDTVSLEDLLEQFESFLKACGYPFDGTLEIAENVIHDSSN
jgi:hypothetical protein